jgi:hypothetical protein
MATRNASLQPLGRDGYYLPDDDRDSAAVCIEGIFPHG